MKIKNVTGAVVTISKQNIASSRDAALITRDLTLQPGAEATIYDFVAENLVSLRDLIDGGSIQVVDGSQPADAPTTGFPGTVAPPAFVSVQPSGNPPSAGEQDNFPSYTLPGGTLTAGRGVRIKAWGDTVGSHAQAMKIYFGGTVVAVSNANGGESWSLVAEVYYGSSANNQISLGNGQSGPVAQDPLLNAPTEDTTAGIVIKTAIYHNNGSYAATRYGFVVENI